jgi:hypothetical protein
MSPPLREPPDNGPLTYTVWKGAGPDWIEFCVGAGVTLMVLLGMILLLCGCASPPPPTQIQADQAQIQAAIVGACNKVQIAMTLAAPFAAIPQVGAVMDYGKAACFGGEAIAALTTKAVNDPRTIAWVEDLAQKIANAPKSPVRLMLFSDGRGLCAAAEMVRDRVYD